MEYAAWNVSRVCVCVCAHTQMDINIYVYVICFYSFLKDLFIVYLFILFIFGCVGS